MNSPGCERLKNFSCLLLLPDAFPNGNAVGRAGQMIAKGLVAANHTAAIVSRWSSQAGIEVEEDGIDVQTFGVFDRTLQKKINRWTWIYSAVGFSIACAWRVALGEYKAVLMYGVSPLFLPAALVARALRRPVAFVQYDIYRPTTLDCRLKQRMAGLYEYTERFLARTAHMLVLSESRMLMENFEALAPGVHQFPNWPPTDSRYFGGGSRIRGRQLCGVSNDIPLVVYTGALNRLEGVDLLITAMAEVARQRPGVMLVIAGPVTGDILPGLPPDYHQMPADLGISGVVKFLGTVGKEAVRDLLAAADCLVMPKRDHEGNEAASPIKLGEYLSSGRPVVASRVCGIEKWLADGQSIAFCQPGAPSDLARALLEVISDPELSRRLGETGREAGERHCDYRQWGQAFLTAWNAILSQGSTEKS